jgi:hypothetical protein
MRQVSKACFHYVLNPADGSLRHTVCMVVAGKAVLEARTIRTKPRSLIQLSQRFRVCQGEDRCVLLLGYEEQMTEMFQVSGLEKYRKSC